MNIVINVIFGLVLIAAFAILGLSLKEYVKNEEETQKLFSKKYLSIYLSLGASALTSLLLVIQFVTKMNDLGSILLTSFGALISGLALPLVVTAFVIHYYKFNVLNYKRKQSFLLLVISALLSVLGVFMLLDGLTYGGIIVFPLPKGIPFSDPKVTFYALLILIGAVTSYALSDHAFFKKYGKHGILENLFYVAFPAGIIGARIWYVIGEWSTYAADPIRLFYVWEGGLAIMGGALFGGIAGIIFFLLRRKEYDLLWAADVIIPTILIAQAIGRWGNFMNQEVYGMPIQNIDNWWFLPEFIKQQMFIDGAYQQPFFLIESLLNFTGYFVIRYGIGVGLKKYKKPLDMAFMYLVWYGLVRFIMEPLRHPDFQMGENKTWSMYNALIFLAIGVVCIVLNHFLDFEKLRNNYLAKKKVNIGTNNDGVEDKLNDK